MSSQRNNKALRNNFLKKLLNTVVAMAFFALLGISFISHAQQQTQPSIENFVKSLYTNDNPYQFDRFYANKPQGFTVAYPNTFQPYEINTAKKSGVKLARQDGTITIAGYPNLQNQEPIEWAKNNSTESNFDEGKLIHHYHSNPYSTEVVAGIDTLSYTINNQGLKDFFILKNRNHMLVLQVDYTTKNNSIRTEFKQIISSLKFFTQTI